MLRGALAASVTPLRDGGDAVDHDAFGPLVQFLVAGGLDGILALGTTGEGIMLSLTERRAVAELFLAARPTGFAVAVNCGAQTTGETVTLASHAAQIGADAVVVIAPPYFRFDQPSLFEHLRRAAEAAGPLPFYIYEFAARSGYAIPIPLIERLREAVPNLGGLKVSDTPFEAVVPYLLEGLDVFVGSEPLVLRGLERGAVGAVSGLAAAFPETVADLVHRRSPAAHRAVVELRRTMDALPFHSALKAVLAERGVPVRPDVRAPLRVVTQEERERAIALLSLIQRV
jgi:dihydrodipicolinate synthase/N-acetylneuraminate lyase